MSNAILDESNSEKNSGMPYEQIIRLTGIYGVHTRPEFKLNGYFKTLDVVHIDQSVVVEIESNILKEFKVEIRHRRKVIINHLIVSTDSENGVSLRILFEQVEQAIKYGYKSIQLYAYGEKSQPGETKPKYNGHLMWGKFGFVMDKESQGKFNKIMKINNRVERSIYELHQSNSGIEFWEKNGFNWIGELNLSTRSKSLRRFYAYVEGKKRK